MQYVKPHTARFLEMPCQTTVAPDASVLNPVTTFYHLNFHQLFDIFYLLFICFIYYLLLLFFYYFFKYIIVKGERPERFEYYSCPLLLGQTQDSCLVLTKRILKTPGFFPIGALCFLFSSLFFLSNKQDIFIVLDSWKYHSMT